jgi:hypothetical protein
MPRALPPALGAINMPVSKVKPETVMPLSSDATSSTCARTSSRTYPLGQPQLPPASALCRRHFLPLPKAACLSPSTDSSVINADTLPDAEPERAL